MCNTNLKTEEVGRGGKSPPPKKFCTHILAKDFFFFFFDKFVGVSVVASGCVATVVQISTVFLFMVFPTTPLLRTFCALCPQKKNTQIHTPILHISCVLSA